MKEIVQAKLTELYGLCARINLETEKCCFFDMSGHVGQVAISIAASKKEYLLKFHKIEVQYVARPYEECGNTRVLADLDKAIADLNLFLTENITIKYVAYCNLIDMACKQTFAIEADAEAWCKKMERKYKGNHPLVGIIKELD